MASQNALSIVSAAKIHFQTQRSFLIAGLFFVPQLSPAVDWKQWRGLGRDGQFTGAAWLVNCSYANNDLNVFQWK